MSEFRPGSDGLMHIEKVTGDILDHGIDWTRFLKDQGTGAPLVIADHGFAVTSGLTKEISDIVGSQTVVRLSGGTPGQSYIVVGHVILSNAERIERAFVVDVVALKS